MANETLIQMRAAPADNVVSGTSPADHDARMAARADAALNPATFTAQEPPAPTPAPAAERPDWLPSKFKSPEDMAAAYAALEKRMSAPNPKAAEAPAPKPTEAPADPLKVDDSAPPAGGEPPVEAPKEGDEPPKEADEQAKEAVEKAGLDFEDLANQVAANGTINEDSYAALEKAGIPRDYVDAYIEGQQAKAQLMRMEVLSSVGGEAVYRDVTAWAAQNLPKADIEAYNRITSGNDIDAIKLAVQGLQARYEAANGKAPKLMNAPTLPGGPSNVGFENRSEMMAAMRDPRYGKDPSFTRSVEQKAMHTNFN
ncbi:capsid assembly protein [uncultured Caudovirales phage]|uniref:Capsid assembly protein n=1 Tax=uncultured Caudovirales phage TaxID=2100421 RepID=A0A6J5LZX2_9CAUD|nr:capsid assembly protein [uncultured Caudovirales phage]